MLSQETIRTCDEIYPGDVIEVEYLDGERHRMAIGRFQEFAKSDAGDWCIWLRFRLVGVRMIDVVRIDPVKQANKAR